MSTFTSFDGRITVGGSAIVEVVEAEWRHMAPLLPDHANSDAFDVWRPGRQGIQGTITCRWDDTDATGQEALDAAIQAGTSVSVELQPEGSGIGSDLTSFSAYLAEIGYRLFDDGRSIERTFQFRSTGTVTWGTVT